MTDWIEINLPWKDSGSTEDWNNRPLPPDASDQVRELFGYSLDELTALIDFDLKQQLADDLDLDTEPSGEILPDDWSEEAEAAAEEEKCRIFRAEYQKRHPEQWALDEKRIAIVNWLSSRPPDPSHVAAMDAWQARIDSMSFTGRGLAVPGTQIEMADGERHLIGEINQNGGVCDDCMAFGAEDIIVRYRVLLTTEQLTGN